MEKKGVINMLKIIKNNSGIEALRKSKYVLYTEVGGKPLYAKIGLKPIIGHLIGKYVYGEK